jgi:hypothetical protein
MKPKYNWVCVYSDGSRLPQYNADGYENRYQDIERGRLSAFEFWKTVYVESLDGDGNKILDENKNPVLIEQKHLLLVCDIAPGARLIYRKRVEQSSGSEQLNVYLIGWQKTIEGRNVQSIACVPDYNDVILFVDGWREGSRWLYPIQEYAYEKE